MNDDIKKHKLAELLKDVNLDELEQAVSDLRKAGISGETVDLVMDVVKTLKNPKLQNSFETAPSSSPTPDGMW